MIWSVYHCILLCDVIDEKDTIDTQYHDSEYVCYDFFWWGE